MQIAEVMISSVYPHLACHESLRLTFILSSSKLMYEHFKIKNEIDPQCFLPQVCAKTLCSMLTLLEKKGMHHSISIDGESLKA